MKTRLLLTFVLLATLLSCAPSSKPSPTGRANEIFVISPKPIYDGVVGDTLRSVFGKDVAWLNQPEPIFDLFHTPPAAINNVSRKHRNLFVIDIDPTLDSTGIRSQENYYSQGQLILNLTSPSEDSAALYIHRTRQRIVELFQDAELRRTVENAKKYGQAEIEKLIHDKFGLQMAIPRGFRVRVDEPDFLWIDAAIPIGSQGIVIYGIEDPGTIDTTFFVSSRNAGVGRIPGPVEGSYMGTEMGIEPETTQVEINGTQWFLTRGFWKVVGDYMGGPFANYVTVHRGELLGIDLYLQYPKDEKRNFMRQLEALPHTIIFDSIP